LKHNLTPSHNLTKGGEMKNYQMYNGFNSNLLSDFPTIQAKNGAEACKKLLNQLGIKFTHIKRSASRFVIIKAEPFIEKDGYKYRDGIVSWFEVWNGENLLT